MQAQARQVKAEHDIRHCTTAVGQAAQKLQLTQQEAGEAAEAVWKRQLADHDDAVRREQAAYQAEQVGPGLACPALPCPALPCLAPP